MLDVQPQSHQGRPSGWVYTNVHNFVIHQNHGSRHRIVPILIFWGEIIMSISDCIDVLSVQVSITVIWWLLGDLWRIIVISPRLQDNKERTHTDCLKTVSRLKGFHQDRLRLHNIVTLIDQDWGWFQPKKTLQFLSTRLQYLYYSVCLTASMISFLCLAYIYILIIVLLWIKSIYCIKIARRLLRLQEDLKRLQSDKDCKPTIKNS